MKMIMKTTVSFVRATSAIGFAVAALAAVNFNTQAELIYGVSDQLNQLVSFDSSTPGNLDSAYALVGMASGEQIRGIDWINGTLYGLGDHSDLYTINPSTAVCTLVGSFTPLLDGVDFGFNAGPSLLYVSSDLGQNLTLNPNTAAATAMPNYSAGASIDAIAYDYVSQSFYGISADNHDLFSVNPTTGGVTLIGPTGVNFLDRVGFDISPNTDVAYFSATVGGQTEFFTVNKITGALTVVGDVGTPGEFSSGLDSIAVVGTITPTPEPTTAAFLAIGGGLALTILRRKK
jgi:hypothetical protein